MEAGTKDEGEYVEVKNKRSLVWEHFLINTADRLKVKCKHCDKFLQRPPSATTTSMTYHTLFLAINKFWPTVQENGFWI